MEECHSAMQQERLFGGSESGCFSDIRLRDSKKKGGLNYVESRRLSVGNEAVDVADCAE